MFCPNCGNDCVDEKFCPACGQALSPAEEIDTGDFPESLMGRYDGIDGYIELSFYTLTIHKEILGTTVEHVMFYRDITDVVFRQASTSENGYLVIREKEDTYWPVENELDASCDVKTLVFGGEMNSAFGRVYDYLILAIDLEQSSDKNAHPVLSKRENIRCPGCQSEKYVVRGRLFDPERFYGPRVIYTKSSWVMLLGSVLEFCRVILARKKICECLACGRRWIA